MRYHKKIGTNRFSCIGVDTKRNHKCIHTCYRQRRYKNICCTNTLKRNNSLNTTNFCPLRESRDTWRPTNRRLNCIIYVRILWNINYMRMRRRKIDEYRKGCNIWMICLEINRIFYDPSWILQLSEFVWTLRSSAWVVFNNVLIIDATDKSKISSDQNRNPFKTLNLNRNPILCKDVSKIYLRRTQIFEDYKPGRFSIFYLVYNLYTFLLSLSSIFVFS